MKKVISALAMLAIVSLASCEKDMDRTDFYNPAKSISVDGLDVKTEEIKRDQMTVHVDKEVQLVVAFNPGYASDKDEFTFTYSSSDITVATIDEEGKIKTGKTTADKPKETVITVTPVNKPEMKFEFTLVLIKKDIVSLSTKTDFSKGMFIRKETGELPFVGELAFTPSDASKQGVTYTSENETIAKFDSISIPDGKDKDDKVKYKKVWGVIAGEVGTTKLTITPIDNPAAKYEIDVHVIDSYELEKSAWTVDLVFPNLKDPSMVNKDNLIDGKKDTYMTLAKPGQLEVAADAKIALALDRGNSEKFNVLQVIHSGENVSERILTVSIYGKDNMLLDWTLVQKDVKITDADKKAVESPMIELENACKFRYIKVDVTEWDIKEEASETLKIAELNFLGYR